MHMFTVKFINFYDDGTQVENCIRCVHYEARRTSEGAWGITVYPGMTATDGVEWWVREPHDAQGPTSFQVCYVENEAGKTVDKYTLPRTKK